MSVESFLATLARSPFRADATPMTWPDVSRHIREQYLFNDVERKRKEKAEERQRLYQCGGDDSMDRLLAVVLKDPEVIKKRREWIEFAKFNNVVRRVVVELSTVYSQPASRTVEGDENNARYQEVQRLCRQHEVMQRINRMLNLHRALVVMPRLVTMPDGRSVPVIDIITPGKFHAVRHPLDPSTNIALIFESNYSLGRVDKSPPRWAMWTWAESIMFDGAGEALVDTHRPHDFGRIPALLLTIDPPDGRLLDSDTGDDLVAAHKAVWFLNVVLLKEAKSATKQPVLQGDLSRATRGQADDSEMPLELPEGTTASTLDRAMDLGLFRESARHVYETAAANYGLSAQLLNQGGVQSADARELMRVPLRELRLQQQIPFRDFEREIASLLSLVMAGTDLAFTMDGWSIDFADPQTPLGTAEALTVLEKELAMGLTSHAAELVRRNPDLSMEQAWSVLRRFIKDQTTRIVLMRDYQAAAGAMAQSALPVEQQAPTEPNGGRPMHDDPQRDA